MGRDCRPPAGRPAQPRRILASMLQRLRDARSAEGSATRLVRGTLINALSSGAAGLVTLALTPLLIHRLGNQAYGVWILATTLTFGLGYLSFTDLGLEQAAVRFMATARAQHNQQLFNAYLSSAFFALLAIALLLVAVLVPLAHPITQLFNIPYRLQGPAAVAFTFVLAQIAFDLPARAFSAVLESAQRYALWQATRVTQAVLVSGFLAGTVLTGGGIADLGRASFAAAVGSFAVTAVIALAAVPGVRVSRQTLTRDSFRHLYTFSGELLAFRILGTVSRQIDKTVIGIMLSASLVTTYEIGNKLYAAAWLMQSVATSALVPTVAFSYTNRDRLQDMLMRGTSYTLAVCIPVTLGGAIFAEPLIRTWIGAGQQASIEPARLLVLTLIPSYIIVVGQSMLVGLGRVRPMLWMVASWTAINLGLSIALAHPFGVDGVVIATLIASVLLVFPVLELTLRELELPPRRFVSEALLPAIPAAAIQCAVGFPLLAVAGKTHLLPVALALAGISALAGIAGYVLIGLDARRRDALRVTVRRAVGLEREDEVPAAVGPLTEGSAGPLADPPPGRLGDPPVGPVSDPSEASGT